MRTAISQKLSKEAELKKKRKRKIINDFENESTNADARFGVRNRPRQLCTRARTSVTIHPPRTDLRCTKFSECSLLYTPHSFSVSLSLSILDRPPT